MQYHDPKISEKLLLSSITTSLSHYINETDPHILFNGLLYTLLEITKSEYGFIGEVFYSEDHAPYIKSYATTSISWSAGTQELFDTTQRKGLLFSTLNSQCCAVLKTGELVISNQPATDHRSCSLPEGHPSLNSFMGIPFYGSGKFLGVVGLANRKNGYKKTLAEELQPFLITCSNLIQAYRNNVKHQQVRTELLRYKKRLSHIDENSSLGKGYVFRSSPPELLRNNIPILLTHKELVLLELLVTKQNLVVQYAVIEENIWPDIIVGESSLRSLVRRLRKKVPELTIQTASGVGYMFVTKNHN